MSTRSQLGFYEAGQKDLTKWVGLIYRHCDGYPTGILPDIMPFLKKFKDVCGNDPEYQGAWLLHELLKQHDDYRTKSGYEEGFTGFGVCHDFHGDIEYFYAIYPDEVKVYGCGIDADTKDYILLGTVPIKEGQDKKYIDRIAKKMESKR